jgi:hypothetical protein
LINKRNYFLNIYYTIKKVNPSSHTSVDYREAVYNFCKKVKDLIEEPAKEIFKLPEECYKKLELRKAEIRNAGIPFASGPVEKGKPYRIDPAKQNEWNEVLAGINMKYAEYIKKEDEINTEFDKWLDKKIQLSIEKIPSSEIPSFNDERGIESQMAYNSIRELLAEDSEKDEDDGKEIE